MLLIYINDKPDTKLRLSANDPALWPEITTSDSLCRKFNDTDYF
jgi:hypothetical protein